MSTPSPAPHTREWHYAEADRLLARAAEVTKEFTEIKGTSSVDADKQAVLATLGGMLTRRASAHANLARASEMVADDAISGQYSEAYTTMGELL